MTDAPTTEEAPIWVFDPDRRRVTWANAAGVAFWGEESLVDLVDRSFAPDAALVRSLAALTPRLSTTTAPIDAPVVLRIGGGPRRARCRVRRTVLPDGRMGIETQVLAALEPPEDARANRLAEMLDHLPIPVTLFDQEGRALRQNQPADAAFGPLDGENAKRDVAGDAARATRFDARAAVAADGVAALRACLLEGAESRLMTLATRFGLRRHRVDLRRVIDPETDALAVVAAFDDIADRDAARRAGDAGPTAAGPSSLLNDWDGVAAGLVLVDRSGRVLAANDLARVQLGWPDAFPAPLTARSTVADHDAWAALLSADGGGDQELRGAASGAGAWLRATARPAPRAFGDAVIVTLVDTRREGRAIMRLARQMRDSAAALDALDVAVATLDPSGRVRTVSAAAATLFETEALAGRSLADLLDADGAAALRTRLAPPAEAETPTPDAFDARLRWNGARVRAATGPARRGQPLALALRRTRGDDAEAGLRDEPPRGAPAAPREAALMTVGHELRTQLNTIIGFAEILRADPTLIRTSEARAYVNGIWDSGLLIRDTLAAVEDRHGGSSCGDAPTVLNWVDLDRLLADLATAFGAKLDGPIAPRQALVSAEALRGGLRTLVEQTRAAAAEFGSAMREPALSLRARETTTGDLRIEALLETDRGLIAPQIDAARITPADRSQFDVDADGREGVGLLIRRPRLRPR